MFQLFSRISKVERYFGPCLGNKRLFITTADILREIAIQCAVKRKRTAGDLVSHLFRYKRQEMINKNCSMTKSLIYFPTTRKYQNYFVLAWDLCYDSEQSLNNLIASLSFMSKLYLSHKPSSFQFRKIPVSAQEKARHGNRSV